MKTLRLAQLSVLVLCVLDFVAFRKGFVPPHPALFSILVSVLLALLLVGMAATLLRLFKGRSNVGASIGELLVLSGIILSGTGGLANWLFSLEGYAILNELEAIPLAEGAHLQEFVAGPLSSIDEMNITLQLEEVELIPSSGGFYPESRLRCQASDGEIEVIAVRPDQIASYGALRFHQGAFGFTPRIVVLKGGEAVFDRYVPFLTEKHGTTGTDFAGEFSISAEGLDVRGRMSLASLDAWMRGHASLVLDVSKGDRVLGSGNLLPGEFAQIGEEYRVGFAGLRKWSEIDISRRNYPGPILWGFVAAICGALFWPVALWRGW